MDSVAEAPPGPPRKTQVQELMTFLGRPHMVAVLYRLGPGATGPLRFSELQRSLKISRNTLSERLKELVQAGLVTRTSYDEVPPRVEYEPTAKLLELVPAFRVLHQWCDEHRLAV